MVWRDLINQAARRSNTPEMALATIDELGLLGLRPSPEERRAYHQEVRKVMKELARAGQVVIIGRAGQAILADEKGVMHVRLIAPEEIRRERIASRKGVSLSAAAEQVKASDRSRRNYCRRNYHIDWDDPTLYDLVLNTGQLSPAEAAEVIYQTIQTRNRGDADQ